MIPETSPRLVAHFKTDEQGAPVFRAGKAHKHYKIILEVENPPPDTYAATFELDPTFYDPLRTLPPDEDGKFRLSTSSYGDFEVLVKLHTKRGEVPIANSLARALQRSRQGVAADPKISAAIADIANH
jgi:hypothetical protein